MQSILQKAGLNLKGCKLESVIANEMNLKVMMESDYEQYKELRHKFPEFLVK